MLKLPLLFAVPPSRPRATKPAEITRLMPLHPNTRDNGKKTTPPRAEYPAPHTAVCTQPPLHDSPSHPNRNDAVPHIVLEVQGRDYALHAPTDDHIVLATQRALTYAHHLFRHNIPAAKPRDLTQALAKLRIKCSRAESERQPVPIYPRANTARHTRTPTPVIIRCPDSSSQQQTKRLTRVQTHLGDDEHFLKILDIVQNGAFVKLARNAPFRDLQRRLTPVYNNK